MNKRLLRVFLKFDFFLQNLIISFWEHKGVFTICDHNIFVTLYKLCIKKIRQACVKYNPNLNGATKGVHF